MSVIVEKTYTVTDSDRGDITFGYNDGAFYIHRAGECDLYVTSECIDDMIEALQMVRDDMRGVKGCPEDVWIEWSGGQCPVDDNATVSTELRDGSHQTKRKAFFLDWDHDDVGGDIVKYRVVS